MLEALPDDPANVVDRCIQARERSRLWDSRRTGEDPTRHPMRRRRRRAVGTPGCRVRGDGARQLWSHEPYRVRSRRSRGQPGSLLRSVAPPSNSTSCHNS